jgi:hypothetical protein
MKNIEKFGGIDEYILYSKEKQLGPSRQALGFKLKSEIQEMKDLYDQAGVEPNRVRKQASIPDFVASYLEKKAEAEEKESKIYVTWNQKRKVNAALFKTLLEGDEGEFKQAVGMDKSMFVRNYLILECYFQARSFCCFLF